jgi:hypothetical protein
MISGLSRTLILAVVAGGVLFGAPIADAGSDGQSGAAHHKPKIGAHCLIGTWHDNAVNTSTIFKGHVVRMRYRGGDIDHIFASGIDRDSWMHARSLFGTYRGHRLKQTIRGHNRVLFKVVRRHRLRNTEKGWSKGSTNRYLYRGHHFRGTLGRSGHVVMTFHCTARTLTIRSKPHGRVIGRETRRSRKP